VRHLLLHLEMAPVKSVVVLLLCAQVALAIRQSETDKMESASMLEEVAMELKANPCEYALGKAVKEGILWTDTFPKGPLKDTQDEIDKVAKACREITKEEEKISKYEGIIKEAETKIEELEENSKQKKEEKAAYEKEHEDVTDDACKKEYAEDSWSNTASKAWSGVTSMFGSNDKDAAKEAEQAKAAEAHQALVEKCNKVKELKSELSKIEKSLEAEQATKKTNSELLTKSKEAKETAISEKEQATTTTLESIKAAEADITAAMSSGTAESQSESVNADQQGAGSE